MPFFTPEPDPGLRAESAGLPPAPPYDPSLVMDAALRQDNTVVSTIHAMRNSGAFAPEPGHNPLTTLGKGSVYETRYLDRFAGSESEAETRHIMGLIDSEIADKRILEGAGVTGVVAQMIAGTLDPTLALPGGVAVQAGKEGLIFTRAAVRVGLAAGAQTAVQETILHAGQQTRTASESLLNVGSATLLGALLGGAAVKLLTPAEHAGVVAKLDRERAATDAHAGNPIDAFHGTEAPDFGVAFDTGRGPQGVSFFSTSPELASQFAQGEGGRVIPVKIHPGKTATFDAAKMLDDPKFLEELRSVSGSADNTIEQLRASRDLHERQRAQVLQDEGHDIGPWQSPTSAPFTSVAIKRAREAGLDTAKVTGLAEGRGADQIMVLNADNVRSRFDAETPRAAKANVPLAQAAGAAAADTRALELVPTGVKFEKAPFDPLTRLVNSESPSSRRAAVDLAESPLEFKENAQGIPTTSGPALDRSARMAINQTRVAVSDQLLDLWKNLRFGGEEAPWFARARDKVGMLDKEAGLPTFEEFKALVSEALQNGDVSAIPQVQQAAQFIRQKVFDPWKERAIAAKLLPEDVDVKTADSYLQRVYDKQKIAARRPEFVNTVLSWMKADQATKAAAKDRIEGFNRRLQAARERVEKLEGKAGKEADYAIAKKTHDDLRVDIEREIAAWEGKTTGEAKAALKAREKFAQESGRANPLAPDKPRLEGADRAVDRAVRDIIESDRAIDDAELRDRAHEITERILGSPDGRLPYDQAMGGPEIGYHAKAPEPPRGPLAKREFNIPDALIREFLEHDIEQIVNTHLKTMVPDVLLTERFGDVRMTEAFRKIEDDYSRLIDQTKSEKERTRLGKEREKDLRDLAAIRDRIRGVYGMDVFNTMRGMARVAQAVKNYNVLTSMGMAAVSSLPDMAGAMFRWGLGTVFADAWAPFAKSLMTNRELTGEATRQFRAMGIAVETITAQRHHALTDIMDSYKPQSRVERTLQWGASKFQLLNMLGPWTDMGKIIASTVASQELFRAAEATVKGTATQKQVRALAANNIDRHMAARIAEQYAATGNKVDGVHLPNTADWTDLKAREAFEGAIGREADIAIVSPGQEKPLWLSNPIVNVLGQFKSFTASATQRILIANLQRRDAQVMQGLMFSMGLGMVSYKLNSMLGGQPVSERPQDWIKESISRGSVLGWLEEGNALASKATRGGVDMYRMIGSDKPLSRYAGRSVIDQMLGPTAGKVDALSKITGGLGSIALGKGDWTHADTSAWRKLNAGQNLFYLRGLLNQVEQGANNAFGIAPKPEKKPH